jgi:UDPglucose 6-dehydrogenase
MDISFIGLGKLGLCSAACFAAKGRRVIGVDNNRVVVDALNAGQCPIDEPGLPELLGAARPNMTFTTDPTRAVAESGATLIIVPTPSGADGAFVNTYLDAVLEAIGPALVEKDAFHVVDVVSTVMPGSCRNHFAPKLENLSGKRCGRDFGLVYNPEFIALGSVIRDFLHPDLVLIGASDERSGEVVRGLYAGMVESAPTYALMGLTDAEVTKLSINCFVTMKISFANELTALCERTPGTDVDVVTRALGADSRVGPKYLKGGLGFGGPCFPRDNLAMQRHAAAAGLELNLSPSVVAVNRSVPGRIFERLAERLPAPGPVALLGLSYKPGTHIVEESQGLLLARRLLDAGYELRLHDPKAGPGALEALGGQGRLCADAYEAAEGARAVVLLTDWPEYASLDPTRLELAAGPEPLFIDGWRLFKHHAFTRFSYLGLGLGPSA